MISTQNKQYFYLFIYPKIARKFRRFPARTPYGDSSLHQRAIHEGNLGLIKWLEIEHIKPALTYDQLAIDAARRNHWTIVDYFHTHNALKTVTINLLLHLTVNQRAVDVIPHLWSSTASRLPTARQIDQTFLLAVQTNDTEAVRNIILYIKAPQDSVMSRAFKLAIKHNDLNTAEVIAAYRKGNRLISATEEALMDAASANHSQLLYRLSPLTRLNVIEKAFLSAAQLSHLESVRCLIEHPACTPRMHVIKRAWNEAKNHKHRTIAAYLANLCDESILSPASSPRKNSAVATSVSPRPTHLSTLQKPDLKRAISSNIIANNKSLALHGFFSSSDGSETKLISALSLQLLKPR